MFVKKTPSEIVRYVVFVLFKRKWLILIIFFLSVLAIVFGTFLISPQWEATAKILVRPNPRHQTVLFNDLAAPSAPTIDTSPEDLVEVLIGNEFAAKIVEKFKLDESLRERVENPTTLRDKLKLLMVKILKSPITLTQKVGLLPEGDPNYFDKAMEELIEDMEDIEVIEGTSTIDVTIWAGPSELAVDIANTLAEMLVEKTNEFEQTEASAAYVSLQKLLASVRESLEQSENELMAFKEDRQIIDLATEKSLKLQREEVLKAELITTEKNLQAVKMKLEELKEQLSSQPEKITLSEVVGLNETYNRLKDSLNKAELDLANKQKTLDRNHPEIIALRAQITHNREQLQQEQQRISLNETKTFNQIHRDLLEQIIENQATIVELVSKKTSLQTSLAELGQELNQITPEEINLERLHRSVTGFKDRYITLRDKLLELEVQRYSTASEFQVQIAVPAFIPTDTKPDWPIWPLNLFVGLIFGLILGVGSAFFLEYWSDSLETPKDVEKAADLKVLGTVPKYSVRKVMAQIHDG